MRLVRCRRRPHDAQALHIAAPHDLDVAECWLRAHGVRLGRLGDVLVVYGEGVRMPLRLGQWLVLNVRSGAFDVYDPDEYAAEYDDEAGEVA